MDKARIAERDDPTSSVAFQFNPETIEFTKRASWEQQRSQSAGNAPNAHFTGTGPTDLDLAMLLDDTESGLAASGAQPSVADRVERLVRWTCPTDRSTGTSSPSPPLVVFSWGGLTFGVEDRFVGYVTEVGVRYTLFRPSGEPVRAEVRVKLSAILQETPRQNPTSGGLLPRRSHVVARSDSLALVAHHEYGDPGHWRRIAELNDIDDPLRLPAGRRILLPVRQELARGGGDRG